MLGQLQFGGLSLIFAQTIHEFNFSHVRHCGEHDLQELSASLNVPTGHEQLGAELVVTWQVMQFVDELSQVAH